MDIRRSTAIWTIVALLMGAAMLPAFAAPPGGPGFYNSGDDRARDRGTIVGEVIGVDYGQGQLLVENRQGKFALVVLPSTTILRGSDYGTLTDVVRGMHVSIQASEVDGRMVAQIIRILR